MDPGKVVDALLAAGPSAGIGFSLGLLFFFGSLIGGRIVTIQRFNDMRDQRDRSDRRIERLEQANAMLGSNNDELRVMLAGSLSTTRKNAFLAAAIMQKLPAQGEPNDEPPARTAAGR